MIVDTKKSTIILLFMEESDAVKSKIGSISAKESPQSRTSVGICFFESSGLIPIIFSVAIITYTKNFVNRKLK